MEEMVPNPETLAVHLLQPEVDKPNPCVDPTETRTPPTGTEPVFTSLVTEAANPLNTTDVIPAFSTSSKSLTLDPEKESERFH